MNANLHSSDPGAFPDAVQDGDEGLGWTGTIGADPAAATVASALALGEAAAARRFYDQYQGEVDPATKALIEQALDLEPLEGASAAARHLSSLVYPSPDRPA
ncbi:hypothetical protein ABZS29_23060 [Kribbella sp. NPDC005582]|uniref:hypothetical protein n=1 Tax=Kribbella sp. NPDC005582 TaxID=3156893 RepID=UPI0033B7F9B2